MTYVETEYARLVRSRALLKEKLKRDGRMLSEVRRRHVVLAARRERDEGKLATLDAEIREMEGA